MTVNKNDPSSEDRATGAPATSTVLSAGTAAKRTMLVRVMPGRRMGHARCAAVAPEVYKLDESGYLQMPVTEIVPEQGDLARRGARACPERAIEVTPQ
jgi:ferredoxin